MSSAAQVPPSARRVRALAIGQRHRCGAGVCAAPPSPTSGLMVALPVRGRVTKGFGEGLGGRSGRDEDAPARGRRSGSRSVTSALAAIINAVFGTMLAYVLGALPIPGSAASLSAIVDLPFAIPTLVTGVMLVRALRPNSPIGGFLDGPGIHVIFAQLGDLARAAASSRCRSWCAHVQPVLLELDDAEEEAAPTLGASAWATFREDRASGDPSGDRGGRAAHVRPMPRRVRQRRASCRGTSTARRSPRRSSSSSSRSQFKPDQAAAVATVLFAIAFVLVLVTTRLVRTRKEGPS